MANVQIGVIGGSGLCDMAELTDREEKTLTTPFGDPSGPYLLGTLRGKRVAFLARPRRGSSAPPLGAELPREHLRVQVARRGADHFSASAVGSLKQNTRRSISSCPTSSSIAPRGVSARSSVTAWRRTWPSRIRSALSSRSRRGRRATVGASVHRGGTYVCMEGPQFSTLAESQLYRSWGMDVIGMTNLQEAKLAREAEICYVTLALVTDYDCWHPEHDSVTVDMIVQTLHEKRRDRPARHCRSHHQAAGCALMRLRLGAEIRADHAARRRARPGQANDLAPIIGNVSFMNPILAVGSVAFDSIKTPFGEANRVVGGAATYFAIAASFFTEVRSSRWLATTSAPTSTGLRRPRDRSRRPRTRAGRNVPLEA